MRIALGKILLQDPDLLLLDEPTNHLDMETIQWLEGYLLEQNAALVVISHDRTFLDRVCNQIVSTERGISRSYLGNYTAHLELKQLEQQSTQAAFGLSASGGAGTEAIDVSLLAGDFFLLAFKGRLGRLLLELFELQV